MKTFAVLILLLCTACSGGMPAEETQADVQARAEQERRGRFEKVGLGPEYDYCKKEARRQIETDETVGLPHIQDPFTVCMQSIVNSVKLGSKNFSLMCQSLGGSVVDEPNKIRRCDVYYY